tara:strand:+ start:1421 stop:2071 length:651 start_codon:yes stop_codon:yes gene_type:complete
MKFEFTHVKDIIEDSSYFEDVEYGLYCWRLLKGKQFNGLENDENDRVIYVGKANKYIHDRFYKNHLNPIRNFSTLRRAIGAVLKEELSLSALPKIDSKGNIIADKKKACRQYRFDEDGELKINQWMIDNLEYGFIELDSGVDDIIKILNKSREKRTDEEKKDKKKHTKYMKAKEKEAKKIVKPSLNCQWGDEDFNIHFKKIKDLRKDCREEAGKLC